VDLVLGQSSCVGERLSDVFLLEVREVRDDLRRRHAVGEEVNHVRHGDAKASDCGPTGQHIGILGNPVKGVRHNSIIRLCQLVSSGRTTTEPEVRPSRFGQGASEIQFS
jgi:hypothetical protein